MWKYGCLPALPIQSWHKSWSHRKEANMLPSIWKATPNWCDFIVPRCIPNKPIKCTSCPTRKIDIQFTANKLINIWEPTTKLKANLLIHHNLECNHPSIYHPSHWPNVAVQVGCCDVYGHVYCSANHRLSHLAFLPDFLGIQEIIN